MQPGHRSLTCLWWNQPFSWCKEVTKQPRAGVFTAADVFSNCAELDSPLVGDSHISGRQTLQVQDFMINIACENVIIILKCDTM